MATLPAAATSPGVSPTSKSRARQGRASAGRGEKGGTVSGGGDGPIGRSAQGTAPAGIDSAAADAVDTAVGCVPALREVHPASATLIMRGIAQASHPLAPVSTAVRRIVTS